MYQRSKIWPIAALFVVYIGLAAIVPAYEDELYYWCWSKDLQWSYYDHPPMIAVLIWLSTSLFGNSVVGFRIPACVASAFVVYVVSRLTPLKSFVWGMVLSPQFTFLAVLMLPDSPLIMFWAAYLWWLIQIQQRLTPSTDEISASRDRSVTDGLIVNCRAVRDNLHGNSAPCTSFNHTSQQDISLRWWLLGGFILGCGVLSKYTMGLAAPIALLSLLLSRRPLREWLSGYVVHGVVAYFVASPILIYNIDQDFEPLLFQWQHISEPVASGMRSLGYFVSTQTLLFGALPFLLIPWVCFNARRLCRDPRLRVCTCFYILPLVFFLYKSTQNVVLENWAMVSFISFWPLASEWYQSVRASRFWRWATAMTFLPPVLFVVFLAAHLIQPVSAFPIRIDRVYRHIAINAAIHEIARKIRERGESLPVYADTYQMTSQLRFESLDARQLDGRSPRASHFTRPPQQLTDVRRAYVVSEFPLQPEFCNGFESPIQVASVPIEFRGQTYKILYVWLYSKQTVDAVPH